MRSLFVSFLVATAWLACGGSTNGTPSGAGCPTSHPSDGASCSQTGLECEYPGYAAFCGAITTCQSGSFQHVDGTCNIPGGMGTCPATSAQVKVGEACTTHVLCDYPDTRCGCVAPGGPVQVDGGGMTWRCATAPTNCPAQRPLLGTSCTTEGQVCDYGACALGSAGPYSSPTAEKCSGGVWARTAVPCPT